MLLYIVKFTLLMPIDTTMNMTVVLIFNHFSDNMKDVVLSERRETLQDLWYAVEEYFVINKSLNSLLMTMGIQALFKRITCGKQRRLRQKCLSLLCSLLETPIY